MASEFLTRGPDGSIEHTGCLPRTTEVGGIRFFDRRRREHRVVPVWDETIEACPVIPFERWQVQPDTEAYLQRQTDQGQTDSCCIASADHWSRILLAMNGPTVEELDWWAVYMAMTGGRGGVAIDEACAYLCQYGWPVKGKTKRIKLLELWDVPNILSAGSAMQEGCSLWFGHDVHAEAATGIVELGRTPEQSKMKVANTWKSQFWHVMELGQIDFRYGCIAGRAFEVFPEDLA